MAPNLLDLSDELLSQICGYAMVYEYPHQARGKASLYTHPDGVIGDQLSKRLRDVLVPMRCCRKLYNLARREFLESTVIALNLADLRMSACRLEQQPTNSQIICTGNPDPLLANLVHLELTVSVSDMRAPFSQPFASRTSSGVLWKSPQNVLSLQKEAETLRGLAATCPGLKTLHMFIKVDEWALYGKGPDLRRQEGREMSSSEERYRAHAEDVVGMVKDVPVKVVTVGFNHWAGDGSVLDLRDCESSVVIDRLLETDTGSHVPNFRQIARVSSAGPGIARLERPESKVKQSWGATDDLQQA